jgi:hypothetical protein
MNDHQVREILRGFLPGRTRLFLRKDGRRMVLAGGGPADGLIEICRRQGYLIDAAGLRKAG